MARSDTLSDDEIGRIAKAAIYGSERPLTTEEIKRAVDWAHESRISETLLRLVLDGRVQILVPEDGGALIYRSTEP